MKTRLNKIRTPKAAVTPAYLIRSSLPILLLGIALGILSKWLDNTSIDDTIWWQHLLGVLDLRNVFSGFALWLVLALAIGVFSGSPLGAGINVFLFLGGMCGSYHLYTILFSGFNPRSYMMIWYGLTLLSPILAVICWYGKGKSWVSILIDSLILGVLFPVCFSIGFWYFGFTSLINTLLFLAAVVLLYSSPKQTVLSLAGGGVIALLLRGILVF